MANRGRPKTDRLGELEIHVRLPWEIALYLKTRAARADRTITAELTRILRELRDREPIAGPDGEV